ncbi:N-acetyltransferase [Spiroplasma sp. SV19]|uniref:GNAT family N-acetyltransferase n=1 Tax=Spiroplasma sp. SV19 TaxID=2570468 RepID=UPI0024B7F4FF|nr:N-acetyltransferase [Spiroplasma sp. SV19]WHQ37541.1 GNAT family N-acetyltransferase [Spiroplasma sp. SV19]
MMIIKPGNNTDGLLLFLLEQENYPQHYYKYRNLIQIINNPNYLVYKLVLDNNLVGYFILMHSGDDFEIIKFTVKKTHQQQGWGGKMLTYLLTHFSFNSVFLEVNEHNFAAQKLYLQYGFRIVRTIPQYYGNENGYLMCYDK